MTLQISVNGIISFGNEVRSSPQTSGNSFPADSRVMAPFWSNNDIRTAGEVRYEIHNLATSGSASLLSRVSEAIANQTGEEFQATWMLVVEWRDCHPHPHGDSGASMDSYLQRVSKR